MEYPRKYDIIFRLGLPQEYAYSYSPRRIQVLCGGGGEHRKKETDGRSPTNFFNY